MEKSCDIQRLRERLLVPPGKLRLVIDSDAKNEIDDQFAISWALLSPERFSVEAVYAVPFSHTSYQHNLGNLDFSVNEIPAEGMLKSYEEIIKLFSLIGEDSTGRVFKGADRFSEAYGKPVMSEAVDDLIRRGMSRSETLYVAAMGACTNIASALMLEPELRSRICVIWLGGQPPHFFHGREFNLTQDPYAARYLFDCGVPLVWVPCMNVASDIILSDSDVREKLLGKSDIATYLARMVLSQFTDQEKANTRATARRLINLKGRDDLDEEYLSMFSSEHVAWSRPIWDVSTIAFLKNPGWTQSTLMSAPIIRDDSSMIMCDESRHKLRVVNYCQRDLILGDMAACLTGGK